MFNQKEYIKSYIKDNYKTIKVRIRKDDEMLINKINSVDNVNKYILGLIKKDVLENREYNYINNNIKIDFELSKTMANLVEKCEEADYLDDYGLYMNLADAIDTQAKKEVSRHTMTNREWNLLIRRYVL